MIPSAPVPDERGKFGPYGGQFVPETLMPALDELIRVYDEVRQDEAFWPSLTIC
jgi:tryptophan synthase beta chain